MVGLRQGFGTGMALLLHNCRNRVQSRFAPVSTSAAPRKRRPYAARVPADVRREQLLDGALAVIVRDGYDAISIDAIAREAGVTRPVVYGVFDGLGPLLGALLDRQQERALGQLAAALPEQLGEVLV